MFRITDTVKHLIIINVLMLIGSLTIAGGNLFTQWFAVFFPENDFFRPWQVITYMFMHSNLDHLIGNMILLFFFGIGLEQAIGKPKFLFLYISAGLGALLFQLAYYYVDFYTAYQGIADLNMSSSLIHDIVNINASEGSYIKGELLEQGMYPILAEHNFSPSQIDNNAFSALFDMNVATNSRMVGASGAVMGVLTAFGYLFPNREFVLLFPPIPIKVKYLVVGMVGADLISAFMMGSPLLADNSTAFIAHIGGAATGLIMAWYWKKNHFNKNRLY